MIRSRSGQSAEHSSIRASASYSDVEKPQTGYVHDIKVLVVDGSSDSLQFLDETINSKLIVFPELHLQTVEVHDEIPSSLVAAGVVVPYQSSPGLAGRNRGLYNLKGDSLTVSDEGNLKLLGLPYEVRVDTAAVEVLLSHFHFFVVGGIRHIDASQRHQLGPVCLGREVPKFSLPG